ncbi:MAG: hypothetical protein ABUT20_11680 [Bacteroidota bacterium]
MKTIKIFLLIVLFPFYSFCQSLSGLWTGSLDKGADPQRKDQTFELNLTEYRGKIYGYSYTTTIVHDTLFYIVKRVKGRIDGDVCEIKDDELISCNFMSQAEKDIKKTYSFHLDATDSLWHLDGKWKTNKTKVFYSVSGDIKMSQEKDITKSKLLPHLQELNINDAVASAPPAKKEAAPVKQTEVKETSVAKTETNIKKENPPVKTEPVAITSQPETAKVNTDKAKEQTQTKVDTPVSQADVVKTKATEAPKTNVEIEKQKEQTQSKANSTAVTPNETAKAKATDEKKKEDVIVKKEMVPVVAIPVAAVNVEKRKSVTQQIIDFANDSLTVSLYDNGEIDGDTVSVLINGDVIMANQGLKATAIKKTIYITPAMKDSFTLVLYAENLGKYPPNTGLMIVHDGDETYQIRFSADLQKNVAVIFKRKKK